MNTQVVDQQVPSNAPHGSDRGSALGTLQVGNPGERRRPLFLRTAGYEELTQHLGPDQPLCGNNPPGNLSRAAGRSRSSGCPTSHARGLPGPNRLSSACGTI